MSLAWDWTWHAIILLALIFCKLLRQIMAGTAWQLPMVRGPPMIFAWIDQILEEDHQQSLSRVWKNVIRGVTVMMHASVKRSRSFNALEHVCTHGTLAAMLKSFTCLSRSPEVGLSAFSNTDSFEHGWFAEIILKLMFDRSLLRYSCTSWLSCSCPPFFSPSPIHPKRNSKKGRLTNIPSVRTLMLTITAHWWMWCVCGK